MSVNKENKDLRLAYMFLRITMGINMFVHGAVRLPKLDQFNSWMLGLFQGSLLPPLLVTPFAYTLPIIEFILGILLIIGFKTSKALHGGAFVIMSLVFGSCLIEKWEMAEGQMVYALFIFVLSATISYNHYSLDQLFHKGNVSDA